jgi:UTP--glucose-1-phosphate uridylyltransferase
VTVRKAIFPVAGLGTRFLPATKSIPKEILTLVDRPLIDYAVEEAREAGIEDFIFVTSRGKSALSDYFDDAPELEARLEAAGKWDALETVRRASMPSGKIAYVRQNKPLGLGHAVACAAHLIGDEPFAVILPDDVIRGETGGLAQLVEAHEQVGGCVVAATRVPKFEISRYGVIAPDASAPKAGAQLTRAAGLVEKPSPEDAPSDLAVVGRYILTPSVMRRLETAMPGVGGEIQLTDTIAAEIGDGGSVHGLCLQGERFDCGSKRGYLEATVALALERADVGGDLRKFILGRVTEKMAAE